MSGKVNVCTCPRCGRTFGSDYLNEHSLTCAIAQPPSLNRRSDAAIRDLKPTYQPKVKFPLAELVIGLILALIAMFFFGWMVLDLMSSLKS